MNEVVLKQAPEIIPVLTDPANLWVNIILAIITFLAVLVALFQDKIKRYFNKAVLDMKITLTPPDCHQILISRRNGFDCPSIYIRIKVKHNGMRWAQKNTHTWMIKSFTNAHNTVYTMLKHSDFMRKIIFLSYFLSVGDTASLGFVKILSLIGRKHFFRFLRMFFYATQGKFAGILTYKNYRI